METQTPQKNGTKPATGTALARPQPTIRDLIEQAKPKLAQVLPKHLSVDRLVRVTIACIVKTPALQKCTQASLLNSIMTAAQLGVEPTGVLGSAYLVPYGTECTLIVGYRGLIDLARRSGQIESIEAHVVHANDRFRCHYGLDPKLEHEPAWEGEPGAVKAAYAVAKLKDGGRQIEVMTKAQIDAIRSRSKAGKSGPWQDHYEEMARKTVVRRICKYLPLTPELSDALALDDELEKTEVEIPAAPGGVAGLAVVVKAKQAAPDIEAQAEPAHDETTGEIIESDPGVDEQEEIRAAEAAEAEQQKT